MATDQRIRQTTDSVIGGICRRMHPGLIRLLDLIRVNPQDSLLVDRFLILASDLEETSRVDATLGLSEALLRKNPRRAIELAHMVYKAKPGDPQPIELMVEGLENLGRYGKATVLRAELEKVRGAQDSDVGSSREVTESSVATIEKELKFLAGIDLGAGVPPPPPVGVANADFKKSMDLLPMSDNPMHEVAAVAETPHKIESLPFEQAIAEAPLPVGIPSFELSLPMHPPPFIPESKVESAVHELPTVLLNEGDAPLKTPERIAPVDEGLSLKLQRTSLTQSPQEEHPSPEIDFAPRIRATQHSQARSEGIRASNHVAPGVPVFRDMVPAIEDEESAVEASFEEAGARSPAARERAYHRPEEPLLDAREIENYAIERVRMLLRAEEWDNAWSVIFQNWPKADNERVVQLFKELNLSRIDLRYMGWWLDALVYDRRPRYALVLMIDLLRDQPHMALAKQLIARIQNTLKILGYSQVQWAESEGILALLRKLDLSKLQNPAGVAILQPRRVS